MRQGNPTGCQSVKDLLRDTSVWNKVVTDPLYHDIRQNDDCVASEVLARISGRQNADKLQAMADRGIPAEILGRIGEALRTFWAWVGKHMFDIDRFVSVSQVTDRVLYDLLDGQPLEYGHVLQNTSSMRTDRISHIQVFNGRDGVPHIRCKVDGVQQMGVPVKSDDLDVVSDRSQLPALVQWYFAQTLSQAQDNSRSLKR